MDGVKLTVLGTRESFGTNGKVSSANGCRKDEGQASGAVINWSPSQTSPNLNHLQYRYSVRLRLKGQRDLLGDRSLAWFLQASYLQRISYASASSAYVHAPSVF